jgi:hypothetical protein
MGAVFTALESCGGRTIASPSDYIEQELQRESRIKQRRQKMDIMGSAMHQASDDIKYLLGMKRHDTVPTH